MINSKMNSKDTFNEFTTSLAQAASKVPVLVMLRNGKVIPISFETIDEEENVKAFVSHDDDGRIENIWENDGSNVSNIDLDMLESNFQHHF